MDVECRRNFSELFQLFQKFSKFKIFIAIFGKCIRLSTNNDKIGTVVFEKPLEFEFLIGEGYSNLSWVWMSGHHSISKPEKTQVCHLFLERPFLKPISTFYHVNRNAQVLSDNL